MANFCLWISRPCRFHLRTMLRLDTWYMLHPEYAAKQEIYTVLVWGFEWRTHIFGSRETMTDMAADATVQHPVSNDRFSVRGRVLPYLLWRKKCNSALCLVFAHHTSHIWPCSACSARSTRAITMVPNPPAMMMVALQISSFLPRWVFLPSRLLTWGRIRKLTTRASRRALLATGAMCFF